MPCVMPDMSDSPIRGSGLWGSESSGATAVTTTSDSFAITPKGERGEDPARRLLLVVGVAQSAAAIGRRPLR